MAGSSSKQALGQGTRLHGFTVERVEEIPEIPGTAYIMRHDATAARLMWLACDDDDKAFAIGFKTPPADDTGVFHINEHSVLCGSRRFPVKEPFVNLLKTSMQTFLNAMTFADKTVYPVSSTNEQDLLNLMDVYLDAVLHPAIYERPRIFEQEGWHYEVADDGKLVRNGVVYNEMKGSLSNPDRMLITWVNRALFPDTAYGFESGGDPQSIRTLSYEGFIDAHARHYRLDNSYTILYGDVDIDRMLAFIDGHFAGAEDRDAGAPNPLELQAPVCTPDMVRQMDTAPENAAVGLGYVFGTAHDRTRVLAADVLMEALTGSNEAPLKRAILKAGIGDDVICGVMDGQLQPYVFLELRGAKPNAAATLREVVESTCTDLACNGIDRDKLESALAQMEFLLREINSSYSSGVLYAIQALEGWLYDDALATAYLHYEDDLAALREMLDNGGYEQLLREIVLDNPHRACVTLNAAEETDAAAEAEELASIAADLGEDGLAAVKEEEAALRAEQEAPDAPEALAMLPQLHVKDIGAARVHPQPEMDASAPLPCIAHELDTHRIDYVFHYFGVDHLEWDELPYLPVLTMLLGNLGTQHHDASELVTTLDRYLGSLNFSCETCTPLGADDPHPMVVVAASALAKNVEQLATLPREVWSETLFDDRERVKAILTQRKLAMEQSMASAGHAWALARVGSYTSREGMVAEQFSGIGFYRFLRELVDHLDERYEGLVATLHDLCGRVFSADRVTTSFTGSADERQRFWAAAGDMGLPRAGEPRRLLVPEPIVRSEAFIVPANVCFVAHAAEGGAAIPRFSGSWLVTNRVLSLDYLWNEVRVKGGAYGCGISCTQNGRLQFYSYRDPAIDPTLARFGGSADWLEGWQPSVDEFEGYVVSNVAKRDAPVKPRALARRQDIQRFSGITEELRTTIRNEILASTPDTVRANAAALRELEGSFATCVFGGRDQIAASSADLNVIELLG